MRKNQGTLGRIRHKFDEGTCIRTLRMWRLTFKLFNETESKSTKRYENERKDMKTNEKIWKRTKINEKERK